MSMIEVKVMTEEPIKYVEGFRRQMETDKLIEFMNMVLHPIIGNRISARFDSEGDSASGKWAALTEATGSIRAWQGFAPFHPINQRTGALKDFVTTDHDVVGFGASGATLLIPGAIPDGELGKKLSTAQQGSDSVPGSRNPGPGRAAPPRPVLAVNTEDLVLTADALLEWIRAGGER